MLTPHLLFVLEQVTADDVGDIVGAEHCEPSSIYIAATVDQGKKMTNASRNMGVDTLICSGPRLNSGVQWSTGIAGMFKTDGSGTCKNRSAHDLVTKSTAMVGHLIPSVCNNDEFKKVQEELEEVCTLLELIHRNYTR